MAVMRLFLSKSGLAKVEAILIVVILVAGSFGFGYLATMLPAVPTASPSPTFSPSPASTSTPTPAPTTAATSQSTRFPISSATPTPTAPQTSTPTPTPTLTPTPDSQTQLAINGAIKQLNSIISYSLSSMQQDLPRNPNLTSQIQAKIGLLQSPDLYNDIVNGGFFVVAFVSSIDGRQIPIVATFVTADMRDQAIYAVQIVKMSLSVIEDFMAIPFSRNRIDIWYGFQIGMSGGAGVINAEDQSSYEARWRQGMGLYEAGLCHELSHSYIGHEGLNQFLEIYTYNMITTHSASFQDWTYMRDYNTWTGTKTGYAALLDVYQLIGRDAMENAYRIIYQLNPPYGQPLPSNCKQAFVDQAPTNVKSQVSDIVANITY